MTTSYFIRRPVANEYLVRQQDRRWRRELVLVLVAILPVALVLLLDIWAQFRLLQTGYEIDRLERQIELLTERQRQLRLEAAHLTDPERLEELAVAAGLALPAPEQMWAVEDLR
jgi:cell division protein FtsL